MYMRVFEIAERQGFEGVRSSVVQNIDYEMYIRTLKQLKDKASKVQGLQWLLLLALKNRGDRPIQKLRTNLGRDWRY